MNNKVVKIARRLCELDNKDPDKLIPGSHCYGPEYKYHVYYEYYVFDDYEEVEKTDQGFTYKGTKIKQWREYYLKAADAYYLATGEKVDL